MSLDVTTPDHDASDVPRARAMARPARAPNQQIDVRTTSGDGFVHWLPTSAVIAAMAAAYDAADQAAEAAALGVAVDLERHSFSDRSPNTVPGEAFSGDAVQFEAAPESPAANDGVDAALPQGHLSASEAVAFFDSNGPTELATLALLAAQGVDVAVNLIAARAAGQVIRGTDGNDILFGGAGDVLLGGAGDDTLIALSELLGGAFGGDGFDQLVFNTDVGATGSFADSSIERVVGSAFDDVLSFQGERGSIELDGGDGDDVLTGGDGDDTLWGGAGQDTLLGLAGDDTFYFDSMDVRVDGGEGIDTVIFTDLQAVTFDLTASNVEIAYGGAGADILSASGAEALSTIFGGGGNDVVTGGRGFDTAVYLGERGRYDVLRQDDGLVLVTDTLGFEGVDTLDGIEQLRFLDGDVVL